AEGHEAASIETVMAMLQARISGLPASARIVVRAASVFGQTFWAGGVTELLQVDKDDKQLGEGLRSLIDSEVILPQRQSRIENESESVSRHGLARDAAYSLISTEDLQIGHLRAAEFLERSNVPEPMILAEHFKAAALPERALPYFIAAALQSYN